MKLLCKIIKSLTCLEISSLRTTLTEENMASCSRAFRKPQNAEDERKWIEMVPQSQQVQWKSSLWKIFLEWPNGRKTKIQYYVWAACASTRAVRIHNWQVLSATLGHLYSLIKLVKGQSLILCNSKFTAACYFERTLTFTHHLLCQLLSGACNGKFWGKDLKTTTKHE